MKLLAEIALVISIIVIIFESILIYRTWKEYKKDKKRKENVTICQKKVKLLAECEH
jgi:hypothetical protein